MGSWVPDMFCNFYFVKDYKISINSKPVKLEKNKHRYRNLGIIEFLIVGFHHRYRKTKNRMLKVCYVAATSAGLPRLFSFFYVAINSNKEANKAGRMCH